MIEKEITLRVITTAMPESIHGLSAKDGDQFIILLNENDQQKRQEETFLHEMKHIYNGDHDRKGVDVNDLEAARN